MLRRGGLDSSLIVAIAAYETEKATLAQVEARKCKLAEMQNGPPSPIGLISPKMSTVMS
ncbi:uncharacterized protein LAESUDRAFT_765624 [Laetiporus sulphureus 93-53]|uniref:Uncharacterized protein n=1 Tax=Laetiporus sulphureus 93-53 TaxID=1314785 RepID=A0A165ANU8_9APHY|nr:uncharacterized protein LAESUDRAFT_765624 [Laetiporus sulphureus 93-53]KZS99367.1 hypothetical protein LAESUDRAFT_765624 [Laetiporus sulphureus 93-53]